jgi:WD40 repeat protein
MKRTLTQAMVQSEQRSGLSRPLCHFLCLACLPALMLWAGCKSNSEDSKNTKPAVELPAGAKNENITGPTQPKKTGEGQSDTAAQTPIEPFEPLELLTAVEADFLSVEAIAFAPDGRTFVTGGNIPKIWEVGAEEPLHEFDGLYPLTGTILKAEAIAISSDGSTLAIGGGDGMTHLFDFATRESKHTFESHGQGVVSASFSQDGKTLVTSGYDGKAKIWNTESGEQIAACDIQEERRVRSDITPDGKTLVSAGEDALLWSAESGEKLGDLSLGEPRAMGVWSVDFSPDGKKIATGDATADFRNAAIIWSVETRKITATLKHEFGVWSVVFSPDDKLLATADMNGVARIWRLADQELVQTIEIANVNSVDAIAWTLDGKMLAVAGDGTVRLWGPADAVVASSGEPDPEDAAQNLEPDEVMAEDAEAPVELASESESLDRPTDEGPTPSTLEMLIDIIDLPNFPKIEGGDYHTTEAIKIGYRAQFDVPKAREFYRKLLSAEGWKEHEPGLPQFDTDKSWRRVYEKDGFLLRLSLDKLKHFANYKSSVAFQHVGNIDARKLPLLPGADKTYESISITSFTIDEDFETTIENCRKLIEGLGWKQADLPERSYARKLSFRQNAIGLQIDFRKSRSKTDVTYNIFAIED